CLGGHHDCLINQSDPPLNRLNLSQPINWNLRYSVRPFVLLLAFVCSSSYLFLASAQEPPGPPQDSAQTAGSTAQIAPELVSAEATIAKSDWKTAATQLDAF